MQQGVWRGSEVDRGGTYSDTWSVGVVALYMLQGHETEASEQAWLEVCASPKNRGTVIYHSRTLLGTAHFEVLLHC
jgi:hypothetical protein